jgi:hypothetical protein
VQLTGTGMRGDRDYRDWFQRTLTFRGVSLDTVSTCLENTLKKQGFILKKKVPSQDALRLTAYSERKTVAVLVGWFIPFGKFTPWGQRVFLEANLVRDNGDVHLRFAATPHMELYDEFEYIGTQSFGEKAADEYYAATRLDRVVEALSRSLGASEECKKFVFKNFLSDLGLELLLYPLHGYKSAKKMHTPHERGPVWSWGAFLIPEFWFLWYDMWGVSMLTATTEYIVLAYLPSGTAVLTVLVALRTILALTGHRIYFARYGRWN